MKEMRTELTESVLNQKSTNEMGFFVFKFLEKSG